jgi:hypothetical protein
MRPMTLARQIVKGMTKSISGIIRTGWRGSISPSRWLGTLGYDSGQEGVKNYALERGTKHAVPKSEIPMHNYIPSALCV